MSTSLKDCFEILRNLVWCFGLVFFGLIYIAPEPVDPIRNLIEEDRRFGTPEGEDEYLRLMRHIEEAKRDGFLAR